MLFSPLSYFMTVLFRPSICILDVSAVTRERLSFTYRAVGHVSSTPEPLDLQHFFKSMSVALAENMIPKATGLMC